MRWEDDVNIELLGDLSPDERFPDWLVSEPVQVSLFGGVTLKFTLEGVAEDPKPHEFAVAVRNFLALGPQDRRAATLYVFENYQRNAADWGLESDVPRLRTPDDVWPCVHPAEIRVSRRHRRDQGIYVQANAECAWEPEHGLQLVYRHGNVFCRVSEQDGHLTHTDALGLPEEEDRIQ